MFLVSLQAGYQGLVYVYYTLQKEQITKKFCENKERPALKCNGKCHLKKMLVAAEDPDTKESSIPPKEIDTRPLVGLLQVLPSLFSFSTFSIPLWNTPNHRYYVCHYEHLAAFELLDPPKPIRGSILS